MATTVTASVNEISERNPNLSKWNLLFDNNNTEWISFKPELGFFVFPCYICRNMFASKPSFLDHINRRTMLLNYSCPHCSENYIFYNSCAFLLHVRTHFSLNEGSLDLKDLETYTLPLELAGFTPHPEISLLFTEDEEPVAMEVYINSQFYSPLPQMKGQQVIKFKSNDLLFRYQTLNTVGTQLAIKQVCANIPKCQFITIETHRELKRVAYLQEINNNQPILEPEIKIESDDNVIVPVISRIESLQDKEQEQDQFPVCTECNQKQKRDMGSHFLQANIPSDSSLTCSLCRFVAPTRCSLQAHTRIHTNSKPYVCPECGKVFEDDSLLHTHMDNVCFHLVKHLRYKCPAKRCGKIFASLSTYAVHFESHLQFLEQCDLCQMTFFHRNDFNEHAIKHGKLCSSVVVFMCPICKTKGKDHKKHVRQHAKDRMKCIYVYICKHCRSYFRSTVTYAVHLQKCSKSFSNAVSTKKFVRCKGCSTKIGFSDFQAIKQCMHCNTDNYNLSCPRKYFEQTNVSNNQEEEQVEDENLEICMLCNEDLLPENTENHSRRCKYARPYVLLERLRLPFKESEDLETSSTEYSMESNSFSPVRPPKKTYSPYRSEENIKKKRKRNLTMRPKRHVINPEVEDLQAEAPTPFKGTYFCSLCDYSHEIRSEFHAHIIEHRDVSTSYQCMECGECFVVKPSLVKHLRYFHFIADAEQYFRDNNCFDKDAVKQLEHSMKYPFEVNGPVEENQCRVCLEKFPSEAVLNKHFRIHGMAFLMRNGK